MPDVPTSRRLRKVDGVHQMVDVPIDQHVTSQGKRKYIKGRQCAVVFKAGRMAGLRCSWYALPDSVFCKRHFGNHHPVNDEARKAGHANWWARMKAIEAQHPGTIRRMMGIDKAHETRAKNKEIEATLLPRPKTKDEIIIKAHKALVKQVAALPAIPDKPFDQLEPHEQLVFNTKLALKRQHEILEVKLTENKMAKNPKLASMVKDAAFRTLSAAIKVDTNALRARKLDKMGELLARLKGGDEAKVIEG